MPAAAAEPVIEAPVETPEAPAVTAQPLPAYAAAPGGGCVETGMRVTVGCGGGAGSSP